MRVFLYEDYIFNLMNKKKSVTNLSLKKVVQFILITLN